MTIEEKWKQLIGRTLDDFTSILTDEMKSDETLSEESLRASAVALDRLGLLIHSVSLGFLGVYGHSKDGLAVTAKVFFRRSGSTRCYFS